MKVTVQLTDTDSSTSPQMSPLLKRILSSPVLYAVSFPHQRRRNGLRKLHTWLLVAVVLLAFVALWVAYHSIPEHSTGPYPVGRSTISTAQQNSVNNVYGVVFDAGSTGSRVHVFELRRKDSNPSYSYALTDELFEHVQPGLSSYAEHPDKAASSLLPLLEAALKRIPNGSCSRTPVVLRATAGLRLLSPSKADNILSAVRQMLSKSCLVKSSNAVSILDGNQEGLYLWISLNFMTDRMPSPVQATSINPQALSRTVGTLDLGGGSTQITFAPRNLQTLFDAPEGFVTDVTTGATVNSKDAVHGKHVYSQSYLGLGLMSARYSMLHTMTKRLSARQRLGNDLFSPCLPPKASVAWSHAGRDWNVKHLPIYEANSLLFSFEINEALASLQLDGSSSSVLNACYAQALQVLKDPVEGSRSEKVYAPSGYVVHRPQEILSQEFYAFSYVFDLASNVGLVKSQSGQRVTIAEFRDAADRVCSEPSEARPFDCLDLSYITALLHDGYGFPWNHSITLQKKIDSYEISWGLGALFAELSALKMT